MLTLQDANQLKAALKAAGITDIPSSRLELKRLGIQKGLYPFESQQPPAPAPEQQPPAPAPAPEQQPPAPAPDIAAAIQAAINAAIAATAQKPEIDEQQIIDLISKHANKTLSVEVRTFKPTETKTITGAHRALPDLLELLEVYPVTDQAPWLAGPAGSGKTTLAEQAAEALQLPFYSTGAVSDPFLLLGFKNALGEYQHTPLFKAYTTGGVFLWDEIDASHETALIAFNQLLANKRFTFPDGNEYKKHEQFRPIAAANTVGFGGDDTYLRQKQDGATLDRFDIVDITYDTGLELVIAGDTARQIDPEYYHAECIQRMTEQLRNWCARNNHTAIISPRKTKLIAALAAKRKLTSRDEVRDLLLHRYRHHFTVDQMRNIKAEVK